MVEVIIAKKEKVASGLIVVLGSLQGCKIHYLTPHHPAKVQRQDTARTPKQVPAMWCRLKFFLLYAFAEGNLPPICVKIGFCDRQILHIKMLAVAEYKNARILKKPVLGYSVFWADCHSSQLKTINSTTTDVIASIIKVERQERGGKVAFYLEPDISSCQLCSTAKMLHLLSPPQNLMILSYFWCGKLLPLIHISFQDVTRQNAFCYCLCRLASEKHSPMSPMALHIHVCKN